MRVGIKRNFHIESGIDQRRNTAQSYELSQSRLGQHCPKHCPKQPRPALDQSAPLGAASRLGPPLDIRQVARLIGCSPWSVRNTWIPRGLPHFRSGASSKLIFYTDQVVRWIERQQQGGLKK